MTVLPKYRVRASGKRRKQSVRARTGRADGLTKVVDPGGFSDGFATERLKVHGLNLSISTLANVGLGRAYVLTGDTVKARAAYEEFFTLWKDANRDIPIFKQARAEYLKLQKMQ